MRTARRLGMIVAIGLLGFVLPLGAGMPALAAGTVTVSTCDEAHLDSAIAAALSGQTVAFACGGTITLTHTIDIAKTLTLDGSGHGVSISGGNAIQILQVASTGNLTVENLTLTAGYAQGDNGGAIGSQGMLTVLNSTFSNNSADGFGGAIDDDPPPGSPAFVLSNSTFTGNSSGGGGALMVGTNASLQATNDNFTDNTEWVIGGGAILAWGSASVTNSAFSANSSSSDDGGGIDNQGGSITVANSSFTNNSSANNEGGAIANDWGTISITNSTIGTKAAGNSAAYGGAIYNAATLSIDGSTVTDNTAGAGGGIYNDAGATLSINGSAITHNTADTGGGIYNLSYYYGKIVTPTNTTIRNNLQNNCAPSGSVAGCTG